MTNLISGSWTHEELRIVTALRFFHDARSIEHDPHRYFRRGSMTDHPERASRYRVLLDAATDAGLVGEASHHIESDAVRAVHDAGYLEFLASAWDRRGELPGVVEEVLTGHFAKPQMHRRPDGLLGQIGYYTADTSTPILAGTWSAIVGSCDAAINAAEAAITDGAAYSLSRPPGHHAFADCAAGFCFLNNTAIAAQHLASRTVAPVGVIDIDVHHGNGTQSIFYDRRDVFTASVHGHPRNFYPYYAGYEDETGAGEGTGTNLNLPLPPGAGDREWTRAIATALERAMAGGAQSLVIALGLDAAAEDPLSILKVTSDGFAEAARIIASAGVPISLVQEGGYLCTALSRNLTTFLATFVASR